MEVDRNGTGRLCLATGRPCMRVDRNGTGRLRAGAQVESQRNAKDCLFHLNPPLRDQGTVRPLKRRSRKALKLSHKTALFLYTLFMLTGLRWFGEI
jgi:hypothetical protein